MQNDPSTAGNPRLPADADAAKRIKDGAEDTSLDHAEGELDKSELKKEQESIAKDKEPFNLDNIDNLKESKKGDNKE